MRNGRRALFENMGAKNAFRKNPVDPVGAAASGHVLRGYIVFYRCTFAIRAAG